MWTAQTSKFSVPWPVASDYGLGWIAGRQPQPKMRYQHFVWHAGSLLGSTSLLVLYPDEEIVSVALTNKGGLYVIDQMVLNAVENVVPLVID